MGDMRIALVCLVMAACTDQQAATADAAPPVNELADRLALCGAAPEEPVLDPATETDAQGNQWIALSVLHWNADATFMDASKAWSNCIVYAAH